MKKIISTLLIAVILFSLSACLKDDSVSDGIGRSYVDASESDDEITVAETPIVGTEPPETTSEEAPTPETEPPKLAEASDDLRPEFKEAMDSYESFYNEYCDFMIKYQENPTDLQLILEYGKILIKAEEMNKNSRNGTKAT